MTSLSLSLFVLAAVGPARPVGSVPTATDAPIRIWLNNSRQFREGERARVQVETRDDGYLLVFNYDTDGRLRVLFPLDPRDDNFVRGGRRYEIEGRGDRESFVVGREGQGQVYAAVAVEAFRLDEISNGGNWDYTRLELGRDARDPEGQMTELVQRMSSDRGFDYDVLEYRVYSYRGYPVTTGWYPRPYYDDFYACDSWYRPSLFGCSYYPWSFRLSLFSPYSYYPYGYGFGFGSYYPYSYYPYRNRYVYGNNNYRWPVVVGRPRGYTITRRSFGGNNNWGTVRTGWSSGRTQGTRVSDRPRDFDGRGRGRPGGDDRSVGRQPSGDRPSSPSRPSEGGRSRGRRSPGGDLDIGANWERDRGNANRGAVDFSDPGRGRGRRVDSESRPMVNPEAPRGDAPARRSRAEDSRGEESPRIERSMPRYEPRSGDGPRFEVPARRSREDAPSAERSLPRSEPSVERRQFDAPRSVERPRYDAPRYDPPARRDPPPAARRDPPPAARSAPPPPPRQEAPARSRPSGGGGGGGRSWGGGGGHGGGRSRH